MTNKKTTIVSKKQNLPYDIYIGRGSKWGNPFTHRTGTTAQFIVEDRETAVRKYKEWIMTQPQLLADLHELKGKILCCYCKPLACHGDVLAELADALPETTEPAQPHTNQQQASVIHISLTGHRPNKLGGYNLNHPGYKLLQKELETYIERNLLVYDTVVGHSGLALGADTIWSKAILAMKERYPDRVLFHAEIPMLEQPMAWFNQSDKSFWNEQIERADYKSIYGSLQDIPDEKRRAAAGAFLNKRNEGMINNADVLLALHDGSSGGTNNAVTYAASIGTQTITVHPRVYFA